ncbi:DUF5977 domain-containing protein [Niastella sp. OAS944]|uniref:DUF5977 domain-containing protein n=1 Tax=Niastella sp. OAS944 TaxID=2664089 RepID=UPI0034962816|nr:YD repeat-containing protein [Chitinophagaceae bacterium OAS944]
MRLKGLSIFSVFIFLFCEISYGQINAPQVLPPSPKSQEYVKYLNYDVSMYNGIPSISIPLYTIKMDGLDVPISLSYHASGIKYHQENGEVGVGWTLSTGYRVSRTVYGFPDEKKPMPSQYFIDPAYYGGYNLARDKYLSKFISNGINNRPTSFNDDLLDGEYDHFNFNLPTAGGTFIITDRVNKTTATFERSNLNINYSTGFNEAAGVYGITGFSLTDETGVKYYAGEEMSKTNTNVFETNSAGTFTASAWAITDIVTPVGDKLHFKYKRGTAGGWKPYLRDFTISEAFACGANDESSVYSSFNTSEGTNTEYQTFYVGEINSDNELIRFTRNADNNMVTKIEVFSVAGQLLKIINFSYNISGPQTLLNSITITGQNGATPEVYNLEYYMPFISVDAAVPDEWGYYTQGNRYNAYFHDEFGNDEIQYALSGPVPSGKTKVGYFLTERSIRTYQNDNFPTSYSLKRIVYPTGGSTEYEYESNRFQIVSGTKIGGGLRIKRIKSNDLVKDETLIRDYVYGANENGYGIFNNLGEFNYKSFIDESIRIATKDVGRKVIAQRVLNYSTNVQGDIDPGGVLSSYVVYPEVTEYYNSSNSSIKKGKVTYKYDAGLQYSAQAYYVYVGGNPCATGNMQYHTGYPQYVSRYRFWDKPLLREKKVYSFENAQYKLVQQEMLDYAGSFVGYQGLKVKGFAVAEPYSELDSRYYASINSFFRAGNYDIECGKNRLTKKSTTLFTSTDPITIQTFYEYNDKDQVTAERTLNSKGEELITSYRYPNEVVTGSPATPAAQTHPVSFLQQNNMISSPLEIIKSIKTGGVEKLLSAEIKTFKGVSINRAGNAFYTSLPDKAFKLESRLPVLKTDYTGFSIAAGQGSEVNSLDAKMKAKLSYDKYDNKGNLIQFTYNNNAAVSYKLGYNDQYAVAECKNATNTEFYAENFEDDPVAIQGAAHTGLKFISGAYTVFFSRPNDRPFVIEYWYRTNGEWKLQRADYTGNSFALSGGDAYDDIRVYPRDAQITSYTYDPLIGMTSAISENGITTYYEYDANGRLNLVRDQNRNILKKICYNYAGQIEDCIGNSEPVWQATTETRCKPCAFNELYVAGGEQRKEIDVNTSSSSYGKTRWVDMPNGNCPVYPDWQNQAETRCRKNNGLNTGEQEVRQVDFNPCSSTYNTERWFLVGTNVGACPLPAGNETKLQTFIRSNCGPNATGGPYTYVVEANKYIAATLAEANAMAQADIDANGQNEANKYGPCNSFYFNDDKSGYYSKSNCDQYKQPVPLYVPVPENTISSTISKDDANNKAVQYAQNIANTQGQCTPIPVSYGYQNTTWSSYFRIEFENQTTGQYFSFDFGPGFGTMDITAGKYIVTVYEVYGDSDYYFNLDCTYEGYGKSMILSDVEIDTSCSHIIINQL